MLSRAGLISNKAMQQTTGRRSFKLTSKWSKSKCTSRENDGCGSESKGKTPKTDECGSNSKSKTPEKDDCGSKSKCSKAEKDDSASESKCPETADCPSEKTACRLGPAPINCHCPPPGFNPNRLLTNTFKVPPFIRPKIFRPMLRKERLGPNAGKCETYKNPEYYSHHLYSFYDLMRAANALKACFACCK